MSSILYTNPFGKAVVKHSYSGGSDFRFCPRKYQLNRVKGWKEKERKASLEWGKCVEDAVQYHCLNSNSGGAEEFVRRWTKVGEIKDQLTFTDKEGDYDTMMRMGREMLQLFAVKLPALPIRDPKFQLQYEKEPFPGTSYAGIRFTSYIDVLSFPEPSKPLIIDIKTAGLPLDIAPEMLRLDPQLRSYGWISGVPDVAFLWMVKAKPASFKKGDVVSLLAASADTLSKGINKGDQLVVMIGGDKPTISLVPVGAYDEFEKTAWETKGKALEEAKIKTVLDRGVVVTPDVITKCRIQFLQATLTPEDIREAGEVIARDIVNIVAACEQDFYPRNGGVRFPNNVCLWCNYLGICTGNAELRDEKLVQIGPAEAGEDWISELEG